MKGHQPRKREYPEKRGEINNLVESDFNISY